MGKCVADWGVAGVCWVLGDTEKRESGVLGVEEVQGVVIGVVNVV